MPALLQKHPQLAEDELLKAVAAGRELNDLLWKLSVACWNKEVDQRGFRRELLAFHPTFTNEIASHLYDNSMYDSM